jgi:hypothetical protein
MGIGCCERYICIHNFSRKPKNVCVGGGGGEAEVSYLITYTLVAKNYNRVCGT